MSRPSYRAPVMAPLTPLKAPTQAEVAQVTEVLENRWSRSTLLMQDRLEQAVWRNDHNAAAKWALAGAIGTDKVLVLKGRPTEIVGHIHAHRHQLGAVMDKLARALRQPASVSLATQPSGPVIDPSIHHAISVPSQQANDAPRPGTDAASHTQVGHNIGNV